MYLEAWLAQCQAIGLVLYLEASCLHPGHTEADRLYWGHRQAVGSRKLNLAINWVNLQAGDQDESDTHLSDIHGWLVVDPAVALGQSWRVVRRERVEVGVVKTNLDVRDSLLFPILQKTVQETSEVWTSRPSTSSFQPHMHWWHSLPCQQGTE